jgi:hypothetical protein
LESWGWGMDYLQNIDVKELVAIILSALDLGPAWLCPIW